MKKEAEELYYILFGDVDFKSENTKNQTLTDIQNFLEKIAADAWRRGVQHYQEGYVR